jgi:hypothetical protein
MRQALDRAHQPDPQPKLMVLLRDEASSNQPTFSKTRRRMNEVGCGMQ